MIFRKVTILLSFFILSAFALVHFTVSNEKSTKEIYKSNFLNLDSLRLLIKNAGWNSNFLDSYQFALLNFNINVQIESERLKTLPGNFEKSFLQAVILKRKGNFKDMFDSLIVGFDSNPNYYPYFNALLFSAKSTGQTSFIETLLNSTDKVGKPQHAYLSGILHLSNARYTEALEYLIKADSLDSNNKNILINIAQVYKGLTNYKKSYEVISKLKKIYEDDTLLKPELFLIEGTLAYLSNDYKTAEQYYSKALSSAIVTTDQMSQARVLIDLGICSDIGGNFDQARKFMKDGISKAKSINDIESIAFGNSELGVSYTFTNELVDAKNSYIAGYELYKKLGNSVRLALLSNNLGKLYMNFFNYKSALKYFEEGIQFAGDDKRAQALNLIGLADVYTNLSNYSKALKYYREAQKVSSEINEVAINTDISTGLGALNFNLDKFSNAAFYYQYALELQNKSSDEYSAADIIHKLALTCFRMDSLTLAEKYFKQSIQLALKTGNDNTAALSYADLADFYLFKKELSSASVYLSKAKIIAQKKHWDHLLAEQSILEGSLNAEKRNFTSAKENFQFALKTGQKLNDFTLQILANYSLGKLFHDNGFAEAARSFYESGISLVEDVSRPLFEESEVQISYFNSRRQLYDSYAQLMLEQKKYEEAFLIIDKSRSRNTIQNLLNLKLSALSTDNKSTEMLYELDWMINSGIYSKLETDSLRRELAEFKNDIIVKHPNLRTIIIPEKISQISNLQKYLAEGENFISIYSTAVKSYLFMITKNDFQTFEIEAGNRTIHNMVTKISPYYNQESDTRYFYNKDLFAFNSKAAYELYKTILNPVLGEIPKNEKLIISPSKELLTIPFEFLISNYEPNQSNYNYSDKNFLVADYSISYSPSALVYIEEVQNGLATNDKILIVGDPAIDNQSDEFTERRGLLEEEINSPRSITLFPLKYSAEEVNMIESIIKTDHVFLNKEATETNFKENAELSKIIHLSTHSLLYKKQPLIFFSNFYDPGNDGFLEASEIVQLKLNSDLVVLSSCSSGLGKIDESEGIIGMTKAFFDAGAKSTIVSLWEVNDKYTSKLMTYFYQQLSAGYNKSEALRLAKVEFIKKDSPNPYFWAGFILSGNTSKIELESPSSASPLISVGLAIMLITISAFLFLRKKKQTPVFSTLL